MPKRGHQKHFWVRNDDTLYTLDVYLSAGPMTDAFAHSNPVVSRTIQIRGDQTLDELHSAIFHAYGREEEHLYQFEVDAPQRQKHEAVAFVHPLMLNNSPDLFGMRMEDARFKTIGTLQLKKGQILEYLFDFGDSWQHAIEVSGIGTAEPDITYPKVIGRTGENPPQYADWDADGADSDEVYNLGELSALVHRVADSHRDRFHEIVALCDAFCDARLNAEYKQVCREMACDLCQARSPVARGKCASWACGIVYVAGQVNFLTDPAESPHLTSLEIARGFGVSQSTMLSKARVIREELDVVVLDPGYSLPSRLDDNPMVWLMEQNGIVFDIRMAPRNIQAAAYTQGLIPYIPADRQTLRDRPA